MDYQTDASLGLEVRARLLKLGIETPISPPDIIPDTISLSVASILKRLGVDMGDDSIKDTPYRVQKMYEDEVFYGLNYDNFPKCTCVANKMGYNEVINVGGVDVLSMCEHHLVPFFGTASVAYIPKNKVLGLSKVNRVVDFFSRRPQVQERLTEQIYAALAHIVETDDVAIVIKAQHLCVKLRGIKQANTFTTTSKVGGRFFTNHALRQEFFALQV